MALSNMQVYDTEIASNTIELLGQKLEAFNAASLNAMQLSTAAWRGNYDKQSFFNNISAAQRRVDRTIPVATQASTALSQSEVVGVKVAGGFGPLIFEPSQMTWMMEDPGTAIMVIAEGFADALLADQLNTALSAAVAATANQAALVNDVSTLTTPLGVSQIAINNSHAKFGDMSNQLVTDFMTGSVYHKLIAQALNNGERLFVAGNVQVIDILGKRVVVTDSPALAPAGKDNVLSVVSGGIIVDNAGDIITNLDTTNGQTRIETTWQADYTFGLKLKGYAWDTANGGASPTDAELATGTNWDKAVAFDKHLLGTLCIGSSSV